MALSNKEKQAAFRAKKAANGLIELRGLYVTHIEAVILKRKLKEIRKK